jgi:cobalamin biosynthesis protein CobD/CbiB
VPLSEDEQRILQDIERSFYENDPKFAESVSKPGFYRHAKRNVRLAVGGLVLCLVVLLATFISLPPVAFVAFIGMVGCAFVMVQNVRNMGSAGLKDAADSQKAREFNDSLAEQRRNLRRKFREDN